MVDRDGQRGSPGLQCLEVDGRDRVTAGRVSVPEVAECDPHMTGSAFGTGGVGRHPDVSGDILGDRWVPGDIDIGVAEPGVPRVVHIEGRTGGLPDSHVSYTADRKDAGVGRNRRRSGVDGLDLGCTY